MKTINITSQEAKANHILSYNVVGEQEKIKVLYHKIMEKMDKGRTKGVEQKLATLGKLGEEKLNEIEKKGLTEQLFDETFYN